MGVKTVNNKKNTSGWENMRKKIFKMISVGVVDDFVNSMYDIVSISALVINLAVTIMNTFDGLSESYGHVFKILDSVTVAFFAVDYILRLFTAKYLYPGKKESVAVARYAFSFTGIVDVLSFIPHYLPVFFPQGAATFRVFRVVRILRLFRINSYYDNLNVITDVLKGKKQQLLSSVFIIAVLMVASSLCMYSVENAAQPDVFKNAFSGIWWSASTLLTVGYGDIYPVTFAGKALGIVIAFLGVGMVAIPTGIISAGFVEQHSMIKRIGEYSVEHDVNFISVKVNAKDTWKDKKISMLKLPNEIIIAAIIHNGSTIIPTGDTVILENDEVIIGSKSVNKDMPVVLKEVVVGKEHPWANVKICNLDISRQSIILSVKRNNKTIIPNGDIVIKTGDKVLIYSKSKKDSF